MKPDALFSLQNKRALVTGASTGIGAAMARAFAGAGADLVIHHWRDQDRAENVAATARESGSQACTLETDLGALGAAGRLHHDAEAALGHVDILVLNASIQILADWLTITPADFDRQIAINLRSSLELLQAGVPGMIARGWGRILVIGSIQQVLPRPPMMVYAATKCAVGSFALNLAPQLAPHGVTINTLAPGTIHTDRNAARLADQTFAAQVIAGIPVGRIGQPGDCAGAAVLLCSDAGAYITGQTLFVDGGASL